MPRTITRTGRQHASLAAAASVVRGLLLDPAAVTHLLGDLLDQRRSQVGPPTRWAVPRISLGLTSFDTVLLPTFWQDDATVHIAAVTTQESDAGARLELAMAPSPTGPTSCTLTTVWRLELQVPLPRTALRLAAPAIDRTVASTVQTVLRRTEAAAVAANEDRSD